jgi:hypothetical protein
MHARDAFGELDVGTAHLSSKLDLVIRHPAPMLSGRLDFDMAREFVGFALSPVAAETSACPCLTPAIR